MENNEYKIIIKFIDRIIKDVKTELGQVGDSIDDEAIKGAQKYMIAYMKMWKNVVKDDIDYD